MNQLSSCITTFCLLCLFIVVIHADTTEFTDTKTNIGSSSSSSIKGQQQESSTTSDTFPTQTLPIIHPTNIIENNNNTKVKYSCRAIGECVPCDIFELKLEEYCHDFGNKEPVECQFDTPDDGNSSFPDKESLPKFQPCKRVRRLERTKYLEFQFLNMFAAFASCSILLWRRRKLAAAGYRRLSRRIRGNA